MADIDAQREIRRAMDSGKVVLGGKSAERCITIGEGRLVITSTNAPQRMRDRILALAKLANIQHYQYSGSGVELGSVCGKPFVVSVMLIKEPGQSNVLQLPLQQAKQAMHEQEKEKARKRS